MLPPPAQTVPATKMAQQGSPGADSLLIDMANAAAKEVVLLEVKEVSVSIPQRKKYDLCFTKNYLYTKQVGTTTPVQGMVYDWSQIGMFISCLFLVELQFNEHVSKLTCVRIEFVFYTPIPEKQQLQYNYILLPRNTALSSTKNWPAVDFEPLVFTVPTAAPKAGIVGGYAAQTAAQVSDSYSSLMHWAINSQLQSVGNTGVSIVGTDPRVFSSAVKQPHRPNERAVHVKAFRGSKDGYLFFLPNGILWGFKKPLLFIPLDRIVAISYTSILQRTFNMVVEIDVSHAPDLAQPGHQEHDADAANKTEELEFGMIDQEDYQGIDETYVRRHGLNNRSMAEGRKAKRQLRENAKGGNVPGADSGANGTAAGQDDMAELERAEQLLEEDEEDEEEEDYDPGSEGESEGEGDSSSEEDDDDDDEEGDEEEDGEAEGYDEEGAEEGRYAEDHE